MMVREVFTDHSDEPELVESLISSVVQKFMGPSEARLMAVIEVLNPTLGSEQLSLAARSIAGQCAFYASHRPFLERFKGPDCYSASGVRAVAEHITTFSLTALGCEPCVVAGAVQCLHEDSNKV
jgi:hypothetical protein